jgi:hypothetical protein
MEGKGDSAIRVVLSGLGLGVAGAALFRDAGFGMNVSIWVSALVGAVLFLVKGLPRTTVVGLAIVAASAVGLGWYSSPHVTIANVLALLGGLGIAALGLRGSRFATCSVWDLSGRLFGEALRGPIEGLTVLASVPWKGLSRSRLGQKNAAVARGALLATPIVLLFGSLFARADAVFNSTVRQALSLDAEAVSSWLWLTFAFGTLAVGVLGSVAAPPVRKPPVGGDAHPWRIGMTELSVVLCSLCALFGLFVAIQAQYLFGGTVPVGLSYADYARRGFFELVWVAGLTLPLLVGAHAVAPLQPRRNLLAFRWMAAVLTGLVFVVMASALARMQIYVESYGLTPLRVSSTAFMAWLALVFSWFLTSLFRNAMPRFASGALIAAYGVVAALNFATPDRIAAEYNVVRYGGTPMLDARHLANLGAETIPVVRGHWSRISPAHRAVIEREYAVRKGSAADWRGATVSELLAGL